MAVKCPKCQFDNPDDTSYCGKCAAPLVAPDKALGSLTRIIDGVGRDLPGGTLIAAKYRILDKLGAGGMGEVYRAEDLSLNRQVAIKVLPAVFATDQERLARFQREAKVLASLNHPNIAAIYGVEEADGKRFLILELVEGETLAGRLSKGPLPLEESLDVCRQIGDALEVAHEKSIIHRDLKPSNIKITPEGKVKILDFGLARAFHDQLSDVDLAKSPTITADMTQPGVILGTAAYMSPEQAKGKPIDKRADIWAFGVVLFEMLTGQRCFAGDSVSDVLAAVIRAEPDWTRLPAETPPRVRELLERCLAKDRRQRLRDMGDAQLDIEAVMSQPAEQPRTPAPRALKSPRLPWVLFFVTAAVAAGLAIRIILAPSSDSRPVQRYRLSLPEPLDELNATRSLTISRDGTQLAYIGGRFPATRIYYRLLKDLDFRILPGSEGALDPFFSPDGRWIGFIAGGILKRMLIAGGQIENISAKMGQLASGPSWEDDRRIYFSQSWSSGLCRVDATATEVTPECILPPDAGQRERGLVWPQRLPDKDLILFTAFAGDIASMNDGRIVIGTLGDTRKRWTLTTGGTCARFLPTGHMVYSRDGNLMAAALDLRTRTISDPVVAVTSVRMHPQTGGTYFAVADTGVLVYSEGNIIKARNELVLFDRKGARQTISPEHGAISMPRVSQDGGQILIANHGANDDINVYWLPSGPFSRVTFDDGDEGMPIWLPGGRSFAYTSHAGPVAKIFVRNADGSAKSEPLFPSDSSRYPFSADGNILAFVDRNTVTDCDIWTGTLGPGGEARPFLNTPNVETAPSFSPGGHWMAYQSNESGQTEVYVVKFPEGTDKVQVSVDGGIEPRWAPSGTELYYRNGRQFIAVETVLTPSFRLVRRTVLFETEDSIRPPVNLVMGSYDVLPDGRSFIFVDTAKTTPPRELVVVLNWFEELKRLVPTEKK